VEPAAALQDAETLARELAAHGILDVSEAPIISINSQPANSQTASPPTGESR
jgi:hypothetical protein